MSIQILTVLISDDFGEMEPDLKCLSFVLAAIPKKPKKQRVSANVYNM